MMNLATSLAQRGADVRVVLAKAQGELIKDLPLENVQMVDLHCRRVLTSVLPLAGYLRREKPAVMLSALDHANLAAIFAKKNRKGFHTACSQRAYYRHKSDGRQYTAESKINPFCYALVL
jgi:hypothetical protein